MHSSCKHPLDSLAPPFVSGDFEASLAVHHVFVDPQAVPSFQVAQSTVTHLTVKAGSMAVDLHVIQDHFCISSEGFTTVAAQIFLKHCPFR